MFQDRHRSLYRCGTDRRALLPKPANGSIFTGHKSHDMYRMMNAKQAAHGLTPARLPTSLTDEASIPQVGLQYPLSTHYLPTAQVPPYQYWPTASAYASHQHHTPYLINANMPYDIQIEHSLRRRALQYVRQHSRPRSASNPVCVAPDETSGPKTDTKNSQPSLRPRRSNAKACSQDRLQTLIAQTSLLTSLLQVYPASVDQDKLREDISTLASTHAEYMKAWIETSGTCSKGRKRMRSDTDSAIDMADIEPESPLKEHARGMVAHVNESMRVESERRKERGEELMKIMRSNAEIWGKHGGSIVDAFGDKEQEETGEGEESEASHERSQAGQVDECDDDDGESEDEL